MNAGALRGDLLIPGFILEPTQGRRPGRSWTGRFVLASLGIHAAVLTLALAMGNAPVEMQSGPLYEVDLITLGPGEGTGHEDGAPAEQARIASVLPRAAEAPSKDKAEPVKTAPKVSKPVPVPDGATQKVQEPMREEPVESAGNQAAADSSAPSGPVEGSGEAVGGAGHTLGLPQGQGGGLGHGGYGVGQVDRPPHLLRKVEPRYPHSARHRNLTGKVILKFLVDAAGRVRDVSVVEAKPEGFFEEAAIQAVSRWEFQPGVLRGQAVSVWMLLPISFALN